MKPTFEEIIARIARWPFPAGVDGVVGIAHGGVVPAALVAQRLGVGLKLITVHYRNTVNDPNGRSRDWSRWCRGSAPGGGCCSSMICI